MEPEASWPSPHHDIAMNQGDARRAIAAAIAAEEEHRRKT